MITDLHLYIHGGIGDQLIALPFINLFKDKNLNVIIYTKFKEVASIFLDWCVIKTREEFPKINPPPIWIEVIDIVKIHCANRRMLPYAPRLIQDMFIEYERSLPEWGRLINGHPGTCNGIATLAVHKKLNRNNLCHHLVKQPFKEFEFDIEGIEGDFITCHDGFDSSHNFELSTKSWNIEKFSELVSNIKERHPTVKVIQLGGTKHRPIKYVDENLAGKLDFKTSLKYLKASMLHIDGDSGLVHARALFKKTSIVLFGPTNISYFGYEENINIDPRFCGNCFWMKHDWMPKCPKEFPMIKAAACMDSVNINHVTQIANRFISDWFFNRQMGDL
jgi:hypothetical protein